MDLLQDVREVSRIGYGFMASKALFAALDLDVFSLLAQQPRTTGELAEATGIAPGPMQMLLTALRSLKLVGIDADGRHVNSPAAAAYLAKSSPHYYGDYFRFQIDRQIYPMWGNLLPALRGRPVARLYDQMRDPEEARHFSVAQHAGSLGPAHLLVRRVQAAGWQRLLDVAGGTGAFSITFCQRNPGLSSTIIDFPEVCELAAGYVAEAGLAGRIALQPGDARTAGWPGGQHAVLMSYLLSAVSASDIGTLIVKAFDALTPGGTLLLHDFMVADDGGGPPSAALWLLGNSIIDPGAVMLTPGRLIAAAEAAGFAHAAEFELLPGITRVVTAKKPE
jgi:2-hydroxy-4-(methylsulfanyl)butanoate S-methyltransferase